MAATVSVAKPASRAATARRRRAARTSSVRERVSGRGIVMAAPRHDGQGDSVRIPCGPPLTQGQALRYLFAEVISGQRGTESETEASTIGRGKAQPANT